MDDEEPKINRRDFPNIVVNQINVITNDNNTPQQEFNHHHIEINQTGGNNANIIVNYNTAEDVEDPIYTDESDTGDYCDNNCIHYREEFLDDAGGPIAEATGNVDYYCNLGHSLGGFCEDYE